MGFFSIFKKSNQVKNTESKESKEWKRQDALLKAFFNDKEAQALQKRYYDLFEMINQQYKELNNGIGFSGKEGALLIRQCERAISLFNELVIIWKKYEQPLPNCPFYAKKAMICEKRGEYDRAAQVCVTAIRAGFDEDGTKGKMQGRLARMLKKGRLQPTPEMKQMMGESSNE